MVYFHLNCNIQDDPISLDLLNYAIFEKYIQSIIENNPLLQVLKEKNTKYFEYSTDRIEKINTKLDKIRIEILKKKKL